MKVAILQLGQLISAVEPETARVSEYAQLMTAGWVPPPLTVSRRDDGLFQILDGNHRAEAARRIGRSDIVVIEVVQ